MSKKINFESSENFIEKYNELKSARKMAEFYNCSKTTILNYAKKIGYDNSNNKEIKITNIPLQDIINDYETLQSCDKVGKKYNCSSTAVRNYLLKNGYELTNYQAKLRNVSDDEFILNYELLKSAKKMSQKYNCSATAILNHAHKINYDPLSNKTYKLSLQDKENIINSYQLKTSSELSKQYNVSRGMITKLWYDAGLLNKIIENPKTTEKDITNQDFGLWHVLYKTDKRNAGGIIYWHCRCACGVEKDVLGSSLRMGLSLSCGHHKNISKGNEKIKILLQQANIPFEIEKTFPSCKDKNPLPFDFYVNNTYLIEYDGSQHYKEDTLFNYEYTHNHDLIKDNWCKNHSIPLIRIPYTHYNDLILDDLLLETSNYVI